MQSPHHIHIFMISVENFCWVLYENLFRPSGLDCWYYHPRGTQDDLIRTEFRDLGYKSDYNHVLFHFEGEPLWSHNLGPYDSMPIAWTHKNARILANSEISTVKKHIIQSRGFIDWYFFYHGFAALDWYRDTQHIAQRQPKNAFLSFNHIFGQRSYRLALLARLLDKNIAHKGSISFHATVEQVWAELQDPDTRLSRPSVDLIQNNISSLTDLPWRLDNVLINGDLSARCGHQEYDLWQNSLWHLVNETVFYDQKLHLTEKIFKPIVSHRPFILVAAPGNLKYLRSYGFETFGQWIDESYDDIQDPDQRLDAISHQITLFAHMSPDDLLDVYHDMMPVLEHNKQHFFGHFRKIIVEELVNNFDQCIRIWNNARIDGRELNMITDLDSVKKILLK